MKQPKHKHSLLVFLSHAFPISRGLGLMICAQAESVYISVVGMYTDTSALRRYACVCVNATDILTCWLSMFGLLWASTRKYVQLNAEPTVCAVWIRILSVSVLNGSCFARYIRQPFSMCFHTYTVPYSECHANFDILERETHEQAKWKR